MGQFVPDSDITPLDNWHFMGDQWLGESIGFSEWLRREKSPDFLGSLALDLAAFPHEACNRVFETLNLPLQEGMSLNELERVLGRSTDVTKFVADRLTYHFRIDSPAYDLTCTVKNESGLIYVVVMMPTDERV